MPALLLILVRNATGGASVQAREAPFVPRKIVLFGDSLTQRSFESGGFGAAIANEYSGSQADTINRGFGGYTTR